MKVFSKGESENKGLLARKTVVTAVLAMMLALMSFGTVAVYLSQSVLADEAHEVEVWILGVEFKGTADAGEPYIDEGQKAERYMFIPSIIHVPLGAHVTLHFFGVNGGGGHDVVIDNYVPTKFTFMRNQTVTKDFTANKAGIFNIHCSDHEPTMDAYLIVEDPETGVGGPDYVPRTREFWVLGAEYKGTADAGEPYIDEGQKAERYMFVPGNIFVIKGDTVRLNFFGVNGGGGHDVTIENYIPSEFTFMRNQTVTKTFVADKAGIFRIHCTDHEPTMDGFLIVEDPETGSYVGSEDYTGINKELWILGVEFKGTADAGEPYIDEGQKAERYMFSSPTLYLAKGDTVTINFFGINGGGGHPTSIHPFLPTEFTFKRNQTVTKSFTANQVGIFSGHCSDHEPTMDLQVIVDEVPQKAPPDDGEEAGLDLTLIAGAIVVIAIVSAIAAVALKKRGGGKSEVEEVEGEE